MLKVSEWYEQNIAPFRDTPEFQIERVLVDIGEQIVAQMENQGVSRAELARRLGVSRPFVTRLLTGNPNLTVKTLVRVALAAGLVVEVNLEPRYLANVKRYARLIQPDVRESFDIEEPDVYKLPDDVSALAA